MLCCAGPAQPSLRLVWESTITPGVRYLEWQHSLYWVGQGGVKHIAEKGMRLQAGIPADIRKTLQPYEHTYIPAGHSAFHPWKRGTGKTWDGSYSIHPDL